MKKETQSENYKQFTIGIESNNKSGKDESFAFTVKRADGSIYEDSDFDFDTDKEALQEAKAVVDEFYS